MNISGRDVLELLVRTAQHFLTLAWQALGEDKKIVKTKK